MHKQTSIVRAFSVSGVGVHTGKRCTLTFNPAPADTGIVFRRTDLPGEPQIPAHISAVKSTVRCTLLANGAASVSTVEHALAALRAMQIDNCLLTIDGPEVPIADGSAQSFCAGIADAGLVEYDAPRHYVKLAAPVWVSDGQRHLVALPHDELKISFTFTNDKGHPALADQYAEFTISPALFVQEIAPARTIGWLAEVEALRKQGLIQGGSVDIAVVMSDTEVLTPLRYPNELVRHKILDTVGDLALLGHLQAHVICIRSGHQMNAELGQAIWQAVSAGGR